MTPQEYVQARAVLLDALDGLGPHRDAVILVGAQAVYAHTGDADFVTAPTTTDADWLGAGGIAVDLMAPEALCGKGRRSAGLPHPHNDKTTARKTFGLEPAVADNEIQVIEAFDGDDIRSHGIKVAGPAALLVSKVVKIAERREQPNRLKPKDGLDVLRLLRAVDTTRLARRLAQLSTDKLAGSVVEQAVKELRVLAAGPDDLLPALAAEAEAGFGDPDEIKMSMTTLVDDLLHEYDHVKAG